jgi:MoaA/NifB/PqqE/SkfB family radical SAM enzyme
MPKLVNVLKGEQVALFNQISIETASLCNRHCHFCPNDYFKRNDEYMPASTIVKVLNELSHLKYKGVITWYNYNEPTRDVRLAGNIKLARQLVPGACQMINTNGDYFKSKQDIWKYFEAGLNIMQINIYSAQDGSEDEATFQNGLRLAKLREYQIITWIDELIQGDKNLQLTTNTYQNCGPKKRLVQVVPKYGIRRPDKTRGVDNFTNRSGNIPGFAGAVSEPLNKHCVRPFRIMYINWTGQVTLCCNDYYSQTDFGNVNTQSLLECWNSMELHVYRLKLQNKKRDCFLCSNCDFNGGYYPHMTDKVEFGFTEDITILENDLTKRETIFKVNNNPINKQGKTKV